MRGTPKLIQRGAYYYISFSEGRRSKRYTTGTSDREQAEKIFAQYLIERGKPGLTDADEILVNDMLDRYYQDIEGKPSYATAGYHLRHLKPFFANVHLSQVNPPLIRQYTKDRQDSFAVQGKRMSKRKVSPSTVRRELNTLIAAMNHYRKDGFITTVPHVDKPAEITKPRRWLSKEEFVKLFQAVKPLHLKTYLMLAIYTAARPATVLEMTWQQIDMPNRLIDLNPPGRAQTKKRRPVIAMSSDLFLFLASLTRVCDHVVHIKGEPIKSVKKSFNTACVEAGFNDVTPYALRHSTLSWIVQAGHGLWKAGEVAGHNDPRTTTNYAHLAPEHTRDAIESIGVQLVHKVADSGQNGKIPADEMVKKQVC